MSAWCGSRGRNRQVGSALGLGRLSNFLNRNELTGQAVLLGCQATIRHQMSIWDALIWAVARTNQVPFIITEDAEHGRELEGVRYLNPFDGAFDLDALGV